MIIVLLNASRGFSDEKIFNVTIGSNFSIKVSDLPESSGVTIFERPPEVYIIGGSLGSTKKRARIYQGAGNNITGYSECTCEWKAKVPAGTYDLYVIPKSKSKKYDPIKITSNFIIEKPQAIAMSPIS